MFYIDVRTPGKLEEFKARIAEDGNFRFVRGKVARVEENPGTGDLLVTAEDVLASQKSTMHFELVVLATGMVPATSGLPIAIPRDEFGFLTSGDGGGLYAAGCAHRPADVSTSVQDATGMSLKALQDARRSVTHAR
jgi:quinone-modifying oxidoreductase subunit QmoA